MSSLEYHVRLAFERGIPEDKRVKWPGKTGRK